jgi:hypothetical protein
MNTCDLLVLSFDKEVDVLKSLCGVQIREVLDCPVWERLGGSVVPVL